MQNHLGSNCHGAKLSGDKLSWCQIVLVPNCPGAKLSWCQIVWCYIAMVPNWLGAKLSSTKLSCCQIVWCQISLVPFVACKANFQYIILFTHILHIYIRISPRMVKNQQIPSLDMIQLYQVCLPTFGLFRPLSGTPHKMGVFSLKQPFWPSGRAKNCPHWMKWSKTLPNTICVWVSLISNIFIPVWAILVSMS